MFPIVMFLATLFMFAAGNQFFWSNEPGSSVPFFAAALAFFAVGVWGTVTRVRRSIGHAEQRGFQVITPIAESDERKNSPDGPTAPP